MKRLTGLKRPYRKTRLIFYTCLADNTVEWDIVADK